MAREPLRVAVKQAAEQLAAAGVASAQVDAEQLAAHLLGVSRTKLGLHPLVESDWLAGYRALVQRRAQRIPLQHLIGHVTIGGATVEIGPGVFIPRPETELLVDWTLRAISGTPSPTVVDLCSGSGVIALAIAVARPDARVVAVERDPNALAWARRNLELHVERGGNPVDLRGGDIADERLLFDLIGRTDAVVANPPYVPDGTAVDVETAEHDPAVAVFGGPDGLDVVRALVPVAASLLRVGGVVAIEHDDSQGESAPALLAARRVLTDVHDHTDLAGRPRFVTARRVALDLGGPTPL